MELNLHTHLRDSGTLLWLSWEYLHEGPARRISGGCWRDLTPMPLKEYGEPTHSAKEDALGRMAIGGKTP